LLWRSGAPLFRQIGGLGQASLWSGVLLPSTMPGQLVKEGCSDLDPDLGALHLE
jgi:hypothetical protein